MASGTHRLQQGYASVTTTYNKVYSSTPHPLFTWNPKDPNQQTFRILIDDCLSMVLFFALLHSLSLLPPINLFPLISWCMAAKQAQTDPPASLPFSVICHSFPLSGETAAAIVPARSVRPSVPPSVDLGAHSLHHSFTSTRETIHGERERGLEAASSVLRPPLILACIIKQVPQSQTAAAHCTADDGDGDVTDGVRIAVYRILRNQSWMSSPFCGGDVGAEQDSGRLAGCFGMLIADLSTSSCYLLLPFPKT